MPSFTTKYFEFDQLENDGQLSVTRGVPYAESETIRFFKERVVVPTGRGGVVVKPALQYTAYGERAGKNLFVLGWNHALLIERSREDGAHYVRGILAYGDSASTYEARVYHLPRLGGLTERTDGAVHELPAFGTAKASKWRLFDLTAEKVRIDKLVTFGITSCSFACLFPKDSDFLVVSHIAFAPPIPLFWLMELLGRAPKDTRTLNLLASLNVTTEELAKYSQARLPRAAKYNIDAKFFLRGPYKCRELGDNAPYRTHPYVTLRFDRLQPVIMEGALGYNNEPGLELELPPLHSCMGEAASEFRLLRNAQRILELEAQLVNGELGFERLHIKTLNYLAEAEMNDRQKYWFNQYKSEPVDALMLQASKVQDRIPPMLKNHERAVFLLAELVASSAKDSKFKLAFDPVLRAWQEEQLGFSFPLKAFHSGEVTLDSVDTREEFARPPGLPRSLSFSKGSTLKKPAVTESSGVTRPPPIQRSASQPNLGKRASKPS